MEDGKRFKLGVGTGSWNGYPVHDACEQWITTNPDDTQRAAAPSRTIIRPINESRASMGMPPAPEPAPHAVMLHFPRATAGEVQAAKMSQTGGRPILVTRAEPGDSKLCFYRLPVIPGYLTLDGETVNVAGGGPLDGGFTLVMLRRAVTVPHQSGTLAAASSEPPHENCTCPKCGTQALDRMWAATYAAPDQVEG